MGGTIIGLGVVWIFFYLMIGSRLGNNTIYDPQEFLIETDTKIQFQDTSCGKQVVVLGKITNKSEQALTGIVFEIEFYDEVGTLIDALSGTEYALVFPPRATKNFKVVGKSGANESQYS